MLAWGNNFRGELGDGTTTQRSAPVVVLDLGPQANAAERAVAVSAGEARSFALRGDGLVHAWGAPNGSGYGNLADGTFVNRKRPVVAISEYDDANLDDTLCTNTPADRFWYLDLAPSLCAAVPAAQVPKLLPVAVLRDQRGLDVARIGDLLPPRRRRHAQEDLRAGRGARGVPRRRAARARAGGARPESEGHGREERRAHRRAAHARGMVRRVRPGVGLRGGHHGSAAPGAEDPGERAAGHHPGRAVLRGLRRQRRPDARLGAAARGGDDPGHGHPGAAAVPAVRHLPQRPVVVAAGRVGPVRRLGRGLGAHGHRAVQGRRGGPRRRAGDRAGDGVALQHADRDLGARARRPRDHARPIRGTRTPSTRPARRARSRIAWWR